jgi:CheY-like chemotaxis protein
VAAHAHNQLSPTLLVVENQARVRLELTLGLGERYDVAAVASAREALDLLALGAFFDVVLCELRMPEMDGVQLCEQLAEIEPALASRVVLISDGPPEARLRQALEALPNTCLTRPFETDALVDALETCRARNPQRKLGEDPAGHTAQHRARQDAACVFALAVRLVRGEVLDLVDEAGWPWSASATALQLRTFGATEWTTMVRGCAADVALEIVRRGLRSTDPRTKIDEHDSRSENRAR